MATFVVCILAGSAVLRAWNAYYPAKPSIPHDFSAIDSVFTSRTAAMADAGCGAMPDSDAVFSTDKPIQKKTLPALHSVDLNTASVEMLKNLPSVGPAMAERIIAFRKNTPFRSVAELQRVHGIGKKKFARIEPYVKAE
ncbi:MAG TPA: helix-hairpin-helix domain-containing protein [Candidatus Kapabacteria bacterium]|nr:helix-hairpin-helix domain-containing protein [Candidatus Kapabacteria bacterium]